jgi:hypothetical protein
MRFDHHSILQNFQFLKESIQALDESYFPYRTRDEIKKQQDLFHQRFSLAKGHFNVFRHWYAHGRKGRQNPPVVPDPEDLFDILEEFSYKVLFRNRKAL